MISPSSHPEGPTYIHIELNRIVIEQKIINTEKIYMYARIVHIISTIPCA